MREDTGDSWLTCEQFATAAGIPLRTARHAMKQAAFGKPVRNWPIEVRSCLGRGGRAGLRYEVALSSLPAPIKALLTIAEEPSKSLVIAYQEAPRRVPAPNQSVRVNYRWRVIEEAVEFPRRSRERMAEIRRASKKWGESIRTIQRWIRELEITGGDSNALARRKPSDAGLPRAIVTRRFDKAFLAAGYPTTMLDELAAHLDQLLKAFWASPAQRHGWWRVGYETSAALARECEERGLTLPPECFELSRYRIARYEHFREVDIYQHDRKRWDDSKPRIRRDNTKFAPMEQIVMDVKPLDCIVRRPDGTTTWPKMIGFMDTGTHRLYSYFVLLAPGEGIRQEHVIDAFLEMVAHPDWGFPQQLYRDNGTEFAMFDRIRDALALINEPNARTIINAKPYSGASKPIESKFATLDRAVFSQMGGWAGGNRMNKKTQTVGKPPQPYSGSFDDFVVEAKARIAEFETWAIKSGPFKGKSPSEHYIAKVEEGWRPIRVNPVALDAAFAKISDRRIDRGAIKIENERWMHPELPNSGMIPVALPYRRGGEPVVNLPGYGWAYLVPETLYLPGQIEGAIEASSRQRRANRNVRKLTAQASETKLQPAFYSRVVDLPTRAAPAPLMDIYLSSEAEALASARKDAEQRRLAAPDDAERRRAREMRITENLERAQGRGRN